jgi:peroxiredoxin
LNVAAIGMALSFLALPRLTRQPWTRAVGTAAPDFVTQTPDGQVIRLSDLKGKPVLLNFFSTSCEWSRAVVPNLNVLLQSRPDVVVLSVNTNGASAQQIAAFARETGPQFPLLLDPRGAITRAYRPIGTPAWFFINAEGVIVAARWGEHRQHNLLFRVNQYLPASEREK